MNSTAFDDNGRPVQTTAPSIYFDDHEEPGASPDLSAIEAERIRLEAILQLLRFFTYRPKSKDQAVRRLFVCAWAAGIRFPEFRRQKDLARFLGISERALSGAVRATRAKGLQTKGDLK